MLSIQKSDIEQYNQLIDDCISVISEISFSQALAEIEKRHEIGKLISSSPLYEKYAKGSGKFLERVAKDLGKGTTWVYESVKFYEKYPNLYNFITTFNPDKKVIRWADVRKILPTPQKCSHQNTEIETIEISRVRCVDCGKVLEENKIKVDN